MVKVCRKCKVEKEYSEFYKDKYKKDGLCSRCKYCSKEYYETNKERVKEYYETNKERVNKYGKKYYEANKERMKEYREANKERIKKHYQTNKEIIKEYNKEYQKQRRKTNPLFKMKAYLRTRTWAAFKNKGYSKNTKTQEMLGVDWQVAKNHIERQFTKGMNWNNYGEWHIDHIIPLASAKTPERLKQLSHYTNLQPMWAEENLSKKDKIIGQQTLLRI